MEESKLLVKDRDIVVPGQVLANGMDFLPSDGTYRSDNNIVACRLGLLKVDGKVLKTIGLSGRYTPKVGDVIIGRISDVLMSGWRLDINSAYEAVMNVKDATQDFVPKNADLTRYFGLDDYCMCKIIKVTSQNLVDLTGRGPGLERLAGGRVINVNPHKVPRIIGKRGSMVGMIKQVTDCKISVGQNGVVWISGEPSNESIVVKTIAKIEEESHIQGLTDRIKEYLEAETGNKVDMDAILKAQEEEMAAQRKYREERERQREERGRDDRRGGFRGGGRGGFRGGGRRDGPRRDGPRRGPRRSD